MATLMNTITGCRLLQPDSHPVNPALAGLLVIRLLCVQPQVVKLRVVQAGSSLNKLLPAPFGGVVVSSNPV